MTPKKSAALKTHITRVPSHIESGPFIWEKQKIRLSPCFSKSPVFFFLLVTSPSNNYYPTPLFRPFLQKFLAKIIVFLPPAPKITPFL